MGIIGRITFVACPIVCFSLMLSIFIYNCRWKADISKYLYYLDKDHTGSNEGPKLRSAIIAMCIFSFITMFLSFIRILSFVVLELVCFHPIIDAFHAIIVGVCWIGLMVDSTDSRCEKIFGVQTSNYLDYFLKTREGKPEEWIKAYDKTLEACNGMKDNELTRCQAKKFCERGSDTNGWLFRFFIVFTSLGIVWPLILFRFKVPEC